MKLIPPSFPAEAIRDCARSDFIGKFGAEKAFEKNLREHAVDQVEVNAATVVRVLKTVAPKHPGRDTV